MKIAIVAIPTGEKGRAVPPLPLGYVAAWLEQQRHIVRFQDLALSDDASLAGEIEMVRTFRPHIVVVAAEDSDTVLEIRRALADLEAGWLVLQDSLRGATPALAATRALAQLDESQLDDDKRVIVAALAALRGDLDELPFPARHLLPIERYGLSAPSGELQTSVLIGQTAEGRRRLRNPRLIIAELRSLIHENGIWHISFEGMCLTDDSAWLHDFLYSLMMARLAVSWEATASLSGLTSDVLKTCKRAGCEGLTIEFDALAVIDTPEMRQHLTAMVREAHDLGVRVCGHVILEPRYSSIPTLVDVSATFGLDDVRFSVEADAAPPQLPLGQLLDLAQSHYRTLRRRQFFINRFGSYLGPMMWRVGQIGLLGPTWQRYAIDDAG